MSLRRKAGEEEYFSNFGSLKSTETYVFLSIVRGSADFSNFGSLKSTETSMRAVWEIDDLNFSNFGSLKSTETRFGAMLLAALDRFQQFRLVEEH